MKFIEFSNLALKVKKRNPNNDDDESEISQSLKDSYTDFSPNSTKQLVSSVLTTLSDIKDEDSSPVRKKKLSIKLTKTGTQKIIKKYSSFISCNKYFSRNNAQGSPLIKPKETPIEKGFKGFDMINLNDHIIEDNLEKIEEQSEDLSAKQRKLREEEEKNRFPGNPEAVLDQALKDGALDEQTKLDFMLCKF